MEECGKNHRSMCSVLCKCRYGTWMLQDDRTVLICSKQVCCCRVKLRGRESKNVPNRTKVKVLFSVFNLQAVLYYCCVFNVMNYPMIIITPHNWYCKNAQFSNRMTSHNSPESKVLDCVGATKGFLSTIAHIVI